MNWKWVFNMSSRYDEKEGEDTNLDIKCRFLNLTLAVVNVQASACRALDTQSS